MGKHGPKRGSRAFWHRGRAKRLVPRIRSWPATAEKPTLFGFGGYKAGMTHITMVDDREAPTKGQEILRAVTLLEVPPLFIYSITALGSHPAGHGLQVLGEAFATNAPKDAKRTLFPSKVSNLDKIEKQIDRVQFIRVHALTQPVKIKLKRTPELVEIQVGAPTAKEAWEYAKSLLGKEVRVSDVLAEGEPVDVTAVTKGHGWQGVVKRFGVALNPRKATAHRRKGGSLGPETQAKVEYTIPRAGQMGFQRRMDRNKRVMQIGTDGKTITPKGGFTNYGIVRSDFIMLDGSVPGPSKRFIRLNKSQRVHDIKKAEMKFIDLNAKN